MRLSGFIKNDVVNGIDVCVSVWVQGCPFHCKGCHNPQTWDFEGGYDCPTIEEEVFKAIDANGVKRNLSILGGEPLCKENRKDVSNLISNFRKKYPDRKIFVWTGYTLQELQGLNDTYIVSILSNIDYLIDGQFELKNRTLDAWLRGSSNQIVYGKCFDKSFSNCPCFVSLPDPLKEVKNY